MKGFSPLFAETVEKALSLPGPERRALVRAVLDEDIASARRRRRQTPRMVTLLGTGAGSLERLLENRLELARKIGGLIGDLDRNAAAIDRASSDLAHETGSR